MATTYDIAEQEEWNPDEIIRQTSSIKDLLSYEFNEENDNIERNFRILELMFEKISNIELALKNKGMLK